MKKIMWSHRNKVFMRVVMIGELVKKLMVFFSMPTNCYWVSDAVINYNHIITNAIHILHK